MTIRTLDIRPLQRRIRLEILGLPRLLPRDSQQVVLVHARREAWFFNRVFGVGAVPALVEEDFGVVVGLCGG
jgi:hypothetical protein